MKSRHKHNSKLYFEHRICNGPCFISLSFLHFGLLFFSALNLRNWAEFISHLILSIPSSCGASLLLSLSFSPSLLLWFVYAAHTKKYTIFICLHSRARESMRRRAEWKSRLIGLDAENYWAFFRRFFSYYFCCFYFLYLHGLWYMYVHIYHAVCSMRHAYFIGIHIEVCAVRVDVNALGLLCYVKLDYSWKLKFSEWM